MSTTMKTMKLGLTLSNTRMATPTKTSFLGSKVSFSLPKSSYKATRKVTVMSGKEFDKNWLNGNPLVFVLGFVGWVVPSSISVPAFDGNSLTGSFFNSIGEELAHFPTGPALDSKFWLFMVTWHIGLFLCLTLGQIGWNGRKQNYFP